jgi:hypothetical protein
LLYATGFKRPIDTPASDTECDRDLRHRAPVFEELHRLISLEPRRGPPPQVAVLGFRLGDPLTLPLTSIISRSNWAKPAKMVRMSLPVALLVSTVSPQFTARMFAAINAMLLDMLAAVARKDYEDRRRRQAQGQAKAKAEGKYRGRPEDTARNEGIAGMLKAGMSWSAIQAATCCSRATVAKVAKRAA